MSHGVSCCLIGGAAVSVRGYARYTEDIDLLVTDVGVLSPGFWMGGPTPVPSLSRHAQGVWSRMAADLPLPP